MNDNKIISESKNNKVEIIFNDDNIKIMKYKNNKVKDYEIKYSDIKSLSYKMLKVSYSGDIEYKTIIELINNKHICFNLLTEKYFLLQSKLKDKVSNLQTSLEYRTVEFSIKSEKGLKKIDEFIGCHSDRRFYFSIRFGTFMNYLSGSMIKIISKAFNKSIKFKERIPYIICSCLILSIILILLVLLVHCVIVIGCNS